MEHIFQPIQQILADKTGLDTKVCGQSQIESVLRQRLRKLKIIKPGDYLPLINTNPEELQELVEELTVSETWFFRDEKPFELLADQVKKLTRPPLILSAPCATGEEPYSIAMSLILHGVREFHIDAIDISAKAIQQAKNGCFSAHSFREKSHCAQNIFFQPKDNQWQINSDLAKQINFRTGNLCHQQIFSLMPVYDFIFCRNLIIYLTPGARKKLIDNLCCHLKNGGLLFTGHSEVLSIQNDLLKDSGIRSTFALRKEEEND